MRRVKKVAYAIETVIQWIAGFAIFVGMMLMFWSEPLGIADFWDIYMTALAIAYTGLIVWGAISFRRI